MRDLKDYFANSCRRGAQRYAKGMKPRRPPSTAARPLRRLGRRRTHRRHGEKPLRGVQRRARRARGSRALLRHGRLPRQTRAAGSRSPPSSRPRPRSRTSPRQRPPPRHREETMTAKVWTISTRRRLARRDARDGARARRRSDQDRLQHGAIGACRQRQVGAAGHEDLGRGSVMPRAACSAGRCSSSITTTRATRPTCRRSTPRSSTSTTRTSCQRLRDAEHRRGAADRDAAVHGADGPVRPRQQRQAQIRQIFRRRADRRGSPSTTSVQPFFGVADTLDPSRDRRRHHPRHPVRPLLAGRRAQRAKARGMQIVYDRTFPPA